MHWFISLMFLIKIKNTLTSTYLIKLAIKNSSCFHFNWDLIIIFKFQHDSHRLISSFVFFSVSSWSTTLPMIKGLLCSPLMLWFEMLWFLSVWLHWFVRWFSISCFHLSLDFHWSKILCYHLSSDMYNSIFKFHHAHLSLFKVCIYAVESSWKLKCFYSTNSTLISVLFFCFWRLPSPFRR